MVDPASLPDSTDAAISTIDGTEWRTSTPWGERLALPESDLAIRLIRPRDLTDGQVDEVVELLREAFNGGPAWFALPVPEADHFRWKMLDAPFETAAVLTEDSSGRIVGFSGRLMRRWTVRGEERVGRDSVEAALLPAHQGKRLSSLRRSLTNTFPVDADFRLSFGSHPTSLHRRKVEGTPELANPLDNLVRPLSPRKYARQKAAFRRPTGSRTRIALEGRQPKRLPRPAFLRELAWRGRMLRQHLRYRPLAFPERPLDLRTVEAFDDRIDAFVREAARPFVLIQSRNRDLLNWRYADRRAGPFTIRLAESSGAIVGYAVTRATPTGADLADLLALPGQEDVAYALVRDALDLGRRAGAPAMRAWMLEHHPYHRLLLHAGFIPVRRIVTPAFTDHGNTRDFGFMHDPHAPIHLMLGDTDHI